MQGFNKGFIYFICLVSAMGGLLFGYAPMKPISLVDCIFPPLPSEDIFFSLCKGKSLFPNGLGIQYGFHKIFLSLLERVFDVIRTKASDCLSSSSTFVWHREKKSP